MNDNIAKRRALLDERIRKNGLIPAEDRIQRMQSFVDRIRQIGEEYHPYAEKIDGEHQGGDRN